VPAQIIEPAVAAQRLGLPVISGFHTNFHSYSSHYGCAMLTGAITAYLRWFHNRCRATLVPTAEMTLALDKLGIHNGLILARGSIPGCILRRSAASRCAAAGEPIAGSRSCSMWAGWLHRVMTRLFGDSSMKLL
jgi:hypothetical protein